MYSLYLLARACLIFYTWQVGSRDLLENIHDLKGRAVWTKSQPGPRIKLRAGCYKRRHRKRTMSRSRLHPTAGELFSELVDTTDVQNDYDTLSCL